MNTTEEIFKINNEQQAVFCFNLLQLYTEKDLTVNHFII